MKNYPTFSIIVPVYNIAPYIRQCVKSILEQDYSNYEILLIDDGSTDNSGDICNQLAKEDIRIKTIHQMNGGLSDARNTGIKNASGSYILFVDGDDYIGENSLTDIAKMLKLYPDIDVMFFDAIKVYPDGKKISMNDGYNAESINGRSKEVVMKHLSSLPKYPGSACTKMIRRKKIIEEHLFFEKGIYSEDIEWTIRLLLTSEKFAYCGIDYYFYRQEREGSITNTSGLKNISCLLNIIEKYGNQNTEMKYQKEVNSFLSYEYMVVLLNYSFLLEKNEEIRQKILHCSWILKYSNTKKTKMVSLLYNIIGLDLLSDLLKKIYTIREK